MGTHPSFSGAGPSAAYTPKSTDEGDSTVTGGYVVHVNAQGPILGVLTDTATPDIAAGGASFSLVSLLKGAVSWLKALAGYERPFYGATALTVGTAATAGRALRISCTAAGNVSVTYSDASTDTFPVNVGLSIIPGEFTTVNTSGTTATATYANLK